MEGRELQRLLALAVVEAETSVVKTTDLLEMFPGDQAGKWSKAEATALTLILEAFGFGMEPDVRLGHANPSRTPTIAVFELPPKPKKMGVNFTFATVLLRLGGGPGMGDDLEVKVLPEPGRRDRREAQGVRREAYAERSVKRTRESTNRNRIRGAADRGERTTDREAPATKGKRRRSGDCAGKVIVLTRGGLA